MNNIFNEQDIKSLESFSRYLTSMGMKGRAELEMYQSDYQGDFNYIQGEGEIPSHLSNNFRVEVPTFMYPIIDKIMVEANKVYQDLSIDEELSFERIELEFDTKERQVSVDLYGTYYGREDGSGTSWDVKEEEPDSVLHKIFETLKEIAPERSELELRYNGSGDSGYIEDSFESGESVPADIEEWCYRQLEREYGGWEINEGSDGNFSFDLKEMTVLLSHTYNTEENISENLFREKY